jgi:hypothetical protein
VFGYILPEKSELKIREYELFRAYYCGVCKSIGKRYGTIHRAFLNYDSTFLALLLSSLSEKKLNIITERCMVHPLKKSRVIVKNDIIDYASDINIILAYYNLKDNWSDERSILSWMGNLFLSRGFKKTRKKYEYKCAIIENELGKLANLEKQKCASMDQASEPFAKLMEEVLSYEPLCGDKKRNEILRWIGYNLGKWIYILDAYDDIEDNAKHKTFNVLFYQFNYSGGDIRDFKSKIVERVRFSLEYSLSQISKAYELLETTRHASIVENIIYMGMLRKTEQILEIGSCKRVEESI